MAIELWLEKVDKGHFEKVCEGVELLQYSNFADILTGKLTGNNIGKLSALRKKFVLGIRGEKDYEVTILNNSEYIGKASMTTKLGDGLLIVGDPEKEDFVKRVFNSYHLHHDLNISQKEKDRHFILYQSVKE